MPSPDVVDSGGLATGRGYRASMFPLVPPSPADLWPSAADRLSTAIGETDCEDLGGGWLAQPVNALSSLAYTVIGLAMIGWAAGAEGRERVVRWIFVGAMVATGVGSFLFHGPQPATARFLHDATFLAAIVVLAAADAAAGRRWSDRTMLLVFGGVLFGAAVVLVALPDATNVLTGISVALLVVSDVLLYGRSHRRSPAYIAALVLLAAALVALVLGRTGAPLCEPSTPYQLHGLWHILSAGSLAAYAVATGRVRVARQDGPAEGPA